MKRSFLVFSLLSFLGGTSALVSCNKEPVGSPAPAKVQADAMSLEEGYSSSSDVDTIHYMSTAELIANNPRGVVIENPYAEQAKQWIAEHQAEIAAHAAESAAGPPEAESAPAEGVTSPSRTPTPYLIPSTSE